MLLAGERLGDRYRIVEALGRGGQGTVYKAIDVRHDRLVALKVRPVPHEADAAAVQLLEARTLLGLAPHDHVVHARDDFYDGDRHVLVLDWVEGIDLGRLVAETGTPGLPVRPVLRWLSQAAAALHALHAAGHVHGDVKPANLVLDQHGNAVLVDLGSTSDAGAPVASAGTPGFRAPEVVAGAVPTTASDVYGLAATAFALLAGRPPDGVPAAVDAISWPGVEPAVRAGLRLDPSRRPGSPGELIEWMRAGVDDDTPTGVVTVLSIQACDAAELWTAAPGDAPAVLARMQLTIDAAVEAHRGVATGAWWNEQTIVAHFVRAADAALAAVDIQRQLAATPTKRHRSVRVGIASGELVTAAGGVGGPVVERAARVRDLAGPGQVLVSEATATMLASSGAAELLDLGDHELGPLGADRLWAVVAPGISVPPDPSECPYPGLEPFTLERAASFAGREQTVEACSDRFRHHRFLAIVGPSGCGKSSLVRAGLGPLLGDHVVLRPGDRPVETVERVLRRPGAERRMLVVDQLEEVVTLCDDVAARARFLAIVADHPGGAIVTLRADRYGDLAFDERFRELLAAHHVLLGPMTTSELDRAVRVPAETHGLQVEPGLVELIRSEIGDAPGGLPLVAHALRETWERRDGRRLTIAGYVAAGGVRGAVAATADAALAGLGGEGRAAARTLLLRMVELRDDGDVRRWTPIDELRALGPDVGDALETLAAARLVTVDDGRASLAHEALLDAWPTLAIWIAEARSTLLTGQQLRDAAVLWDEGGRHATDLYRGARLETARRWSEVNPPTEIQRAFLDASGAAEDEEHRAAERRRTDAVRSARRVRRSLVATVVLLVASLIAGGAAVTGRRDAERQRDVAEQARLDAELDALVERSLALRPTSRAEAALLAVEAYRRRPDASSLSALLGTFTGSNGYLGQVGIDRDARGAALLPGVGRAVVVDPDTSLVEVDLTSGSIGARFAPEASDATPVPTDHWRSDLRISPDGRWAAQIVDVRTDDDQRCYDPELLATTDAAGCGTLLVHDLRDGRVVLGPRATPVGPGDVAISADGRHVALVGGLRGDTHVIDVPTGETVGVVPGGPRPDDALNLIDTGAVTFGPDGMLYATSTGGPIQVVDPATATVVRSLAVPPRRAHNHVFVTPDLRVVALGDAGMIAVDGRTGAIEWEVDELGPDEWSCPTAAISAIHDRLFCGNYFGIIDERSLSTGGPTGRRFDSQSGNVQALMVTDDGHELVAISAATSAVLRWRLDGTGPVTRLVADGRTTVDGWDPSGRWLMTIPAAQAADQAGDLMAWDPVADRPAGPSLADRNGIRAPGWGGWVGDGVGVVFDPEAAGRFGGPSTVDVREGRPAALSLPSNAHIITLGADGSRVYVGDDGRRLRVLDARDGTSITSPIALEGSIDQVVTDADGARVAVLTFDEDVGLAVTLYDGPSGTIVAGPRPGVASTLAMGPDGRLFGGRFDGSLVELDPSTLRMSGALPGGRSVVRRVQLSGDGTLMVTSSGDREVSLIDVATRRRLGDVIDVIPPAGFRGDLASSSGFLRPDGRALAVNSPFGVLLWDLDPGRLVAAACAVAGRDLTEAEWTTHLTPIGPYRPTCESI